MSLRSLFMASMASVNRDLLGIEYFAAFCPLAISILTTGAAIYATSIFKVRTSRV